MTKGTYEIPTKLRLKERGIQWVPSWSTKAKYKKGHAVFIHGLHTTKYHSNKMVSKFGTNVYYGHTHDIQEMPWEQDGNDKTIVGKSLGCLCEYDQKYLKGNPTKWQQGFSEFFFFPDGHFDEKTTRIFKHRFIGLDGKVYDGKK